MVEKQQQQLEKKEREREKKKTELLKLKGQNKTPRPSGVQLQTKQTGAFHGFLFTFSSFFFAPLPFNAFRCKYVYIHLVSGLYLFSVL